MFVTKVGLQEGYCQRISASECSCTTQKATNTVIIVGGGEMGFWFVVSKSFFYCRSGMEEVMR